MVGRPGCRWAARSSSTDVFQGLEVREEEDSAKEVLGSSLGVIWTVGVTAESEWIRRISGFGGVDAKLTCDDLRDRSS
jgi:hypothetical protein